MEIKGAGSQPSGKGPSDWLTGTVRIDPLFQAPDPAWVQGASVTSSPARAPHGIRIRSGRLSSSRLGAAGQHGGGPVDDIRPGDVVWFSPGKKPWHGAAPTTAMTHIAIQGNKDGKGG